MTVNTLRHLEERVPLSGTVAQPRRLLSLLYSLPHGDLGLDCPQSRCWGLSGPDLPLIDRRGVFEKGGWPPLAQVRAALGTTEPRSLVTAPGSSPCGQHRSCQRSS